MAAQISLTSLRDLRTNDGCLPHDMRDVHAACTSFDKELHWVTGADHYDFERGMVSELLRTLA
jgi:hypothetical protein